MRARSADKGVYWVSARSLRTLRRRREDDRKPPRDAPPEALSWCAPADGCSGGVVDSGGVVCPLLDELHGLNTGTADGRQTTGNSYDATRSGRG